MTRQSNLLALPLILTLAACGGGGGGEITSTPTPLVFLAPAPPPAPTPTPAAPRLTSISIEKVAPLSPRAGLTSGTFDTKAVATSVRGDGQILPPGSVKLGIDAANTTYTLTINAPGFPTQQNFDFSAITPDNDPTHGMPTNDSGLGFRIIRTEQYSDGTTRVFEEDKTSALCCPPYRVSLPNGQFEGKSFSLSITPRYVSYGQWDQFIGQTVTGSSVGGYNIVSSKRIIFVQGLRTEPTDIPVRGTASYRIDGSDYSMPFSFAADFGARTMAASLSIQGGFDEEGGFSPGVSASGVAPITSAGDFLIALNGTRLDSGGQPFDPLSGVLDGAFFGPQGAQIGGVYQFMGQSGTFVATKGP